MQLRVALLGLAAVAPLTGWPASVLAAPAAPSCVQSDAVRVWTSPRSPAVGQPLEIMAVATDAGVDGLEVFDPTGQPLSLRTEPNGGPPWSLYATLFRPSRGTYRIQAMRGGRPVSCRDVEVGGAAGASRDFHSAQWDRATEALYSAWIERLFDAPPGQRLSFPSLQPVLRNPGRNFLYGYLGQGEDDRLPATPDCADLPYVLRAYFAWKVGLPIAYRSCSRGTTSSPPRCGAPVTEQGFGPAPRPASYFKGISRRIVDTVHSGSARTALGDEASDFYPVPLTRAALRPGTVYADPYGHVLVIVKWVPQSGSRSGLLLAVDAQPDNTVSRKRFWQGTFLFSDDVRSAGPGFKAFRPVVGEGGGKGRVRLLSHDALRRDARFVPYSAEQVGLRPDDFYARIDRLINPRGLAPEMAYEATLDALMEQIETRVTSVNNAEDYVRRTRGTVVPMPRGGAIFETTGPWEDYSTPSRDMRLLIAMKVLDSLPRRILRYPDLFVLTGESAAEAKSRIDRLHAQRMEERSITYRRSDGSPWRLSLKDIYDRRSRLEVAYNPNDCVELRWGAAPGTEEYAPCSRHAPPEQRARMDEYRHWFRETRRPPR
ncbi:MAG: hypothetical protein U9Q81_19735 [Pseudomonadota bacterium]|nr:hypothetical protein [Pseudomonadota bacterium]